MNLKYKYTLVLGATLALSFCQGGRSQIFNPNGNSMTAQQLLNTAPEARVLPDSTVRTQRYALNYTPEQADACLQTYVDTQQLSTICNQILYDRYYRFYGPGFDSATSSIPDNTQIYYGANSDKVVDLDWRGLFANQSYLPQYQDSAISGYRTPMNMQNFCQNPQSVTTLQYSSPCGKMNWNYTTIAVNGNNGYNYMRQGDFNSASRIYAPGGYMQRSAPLLYGTVLSRRDVGKENKILQQQVEASWTNMKQLPKNTGLRVLNRVMDVPASMLERMVSGFEASASRVSATNYAAAGYNQQTTAYNDAAANNYYNAVRISQYSTLSALQPDTPCQMDKYHYEIVSEERTESPEYQISCNGK